MRSDSPPNQTLRSLPFYFSRNFFLLFSLVSAGLVWTSVTYGAPLYLLGIADAAMALAALLDFFLAPHPRELELLRVLPRACAVDRRHAVSIQIRNRTKRPISLIITDDVPQHATVEGLPVSSTVPDRASAKVEYGIRFGERGDARFGLLHFWIPGRLGLVWKRGEAGPAATVRVYPWLSAIEKRKIGLWRSTVAHAALRQLKKGVGTEFDGLRDYMAGDDPRLIHWPTSARTGKFMVRENRVERSQNILLVLDAGRMMTARVKGKTKFDHELNAALMIAYSALELGDRVGVIVFAHDLVCFVAESGGPTQFGRILDATHGVEPKMEEPRFHVPFSLIAARIRRRSLVIIFTDLIDERASAGLIRHTVGLLPRHLPLVAAISDSEVVEIADSVPESVQDLYRQGVAAEILTRREQLLAKLSSAGVMALDAPPERFSAGVVEQYLRVKRRALL
ncbi:MAG: DUF58 domain-containing protein [Deltaproteobacteria bacterium]|nr:DUF58 domain-containing protein [Deltaproteobacteria bacterium]